jgi:hypothetical protein
MLRHNLEFRNDSTGDRIQFDEWSELDLDADKLILVEEDQDLKDIMDFEEYRRRPKYPRRQMRPGKSSGLSVLLDPDLDSYFCTNTDSMGFMV